MVFVMVCVIIVGLIVYWFFFIFFVILVNVCWVWEKGCFIFKCFNFIGCILFEMFDIMIIVFVIFFKRRVVLSV